MRRVPARVFPGLSSSWAGGLVLAAALAGLVASDVGSDRLLLLNLVLVYSIFALGYDLAFGLGGLLSLGHAAMFGLGAYVLANATLRLGWPFEAALLAAGLAGMLLAAVMGVVALRLSGIFFALVTLAMGQLCAILAGNHLRGFTGGLDGLSGIPRPRLFGIDFSNDRWFLAYNAVVFLLLLVAAARLRASPFGQVVAGIRLNAPRIEQLGWRANRFRAAIFAISGFYAGIAGALLASLLFFVSPQVVEWTTSGDVLIMTVLGGAGTLFGPVLGVAAFELLKDELSRWTDRWYGLLGLIFVLVTIFAPGGIAGLLGAPARWLSRRRAAAPP
ncbi:MAG: branched-chain amino acid ABC transporter permease [Janthinobacterium lividum]